MKRLLFPFALLFLLSGCGFVYRNTIGIFESNSYKDLEPAPPRSEQEAKPVATSSVSIEKVPEPQKHEPIDEIEIIWEIPKKSVDGFVLKYGYSQDDLTFEKRLENSEVEKYVHPSFGPVFRYVLHGIPADKRVFVGMATVEGNSISELSEIFEVTPESPKEDEVATSAENS